MKTIEEEFFEEQSDESEVKSRIVEKYFDAWSRILLPTVKKQNRTLAYVDLYAGPGRYRDGSASTPLLVLQRAIENSDLCERLETVFNDINEDNSATLQREINGLVGISKLKYAPLVFGSEADAQAKSFFARPQGPPTFSFIDPWGYKTLSKELIAACTRDWGSDCVFFFNYRRINAAFANPLFASHVDALFGARRAAALRPKLEGLRPHEREFLILEELAQTLKESGSQYVLPFTFKSNAGSRTTHCLIFVSKGEKGFKIMKEIMAKESSTTDQGVPCFCYSPADERAPLLFSFSRPLEALEGLLLEAFAGQTIAVKDIIKRHHVGYRYIERNYKQSLLQLEARKAVSATPEKRRPGTMGDDVLVRFPMVKQ